MCDSRKYPYPSLGWSFYIPRGRAVGCLKSQNFKGKYEAHWNFQRGGSYKPKNHPGGRYGDFLEQHNVLDE